MRFLYIGLLVYFLCISFANADAIQYQQLLNVYHQLVAMNEGLRSMQPPEGPVGDKGAIGGKGAIGDQGPTGDKGGVGDKGAVGDKGSIGTKGLVGDEGSIGQGLTIDQIEEVFAVLEERESWIVGMENAGDVLVSRIEETRQLIEKLDDEAEMLKGAGGAQ